MYHVKMMSVDDLWVSVGSTNLEARSFAINDEANLNIYDRAFAQRQVAAFKTICAIRATSRLSSGKTRQ